MSHRRVNERDDGFLLQILFAILVFFAIVAVIICAGCSSPTMPRHEPHAALTRHDQPDQPDQPDTWFQRGRAARANPRAFERAQAELLTIGTTCPDAVRDFMAGWEDESRFDGPERDSFAAEVVR